MSVITYRVRNTADHWLQVGDKVQMADASYIVQSVAPVNHEPLILTFGSLLVPEVVTITVERVEAA